MPGMITALSLLIKEMMVFVSFIKSNAFPQPLTEQEEEANLKKMAEGDSYARIC